jgi:hypothetical protein
MKIVLLFLTALLCAGCAETPTPTYDTRFGEAIRQARFAMTIDPNASQRPDNGSGIDGRAARESIKRYQDSFKEPPPVTNVINIGGGLGGATR